jgi:hypothetical protein
LTLLLNRNNSMSQELEYGSHGELDNLAKQNEEITEVPFEEIPTPHEAAMATPAETAKEIAPFTPVECCAEIVVEPENVPDPLAGLSVAQTEFFNRLRERAALYKMRITITPEGEIRSFQRGTGESHLWGSIHDERSVAQLITTMIDATLEHEEVIEMMLKLFPESKRLRFLFERAARRPRPKKRRLTHASNRTRIHSKAVTARPIAAETNGTPPRRPSQFDIFRAVPARPERRIGTEFITGSAGTGKTFEVRRRKAADPDGVVLAATTGIAAVNLGPDVTTVHSSLGFRFFRDLPHAYESGALQRKIHRLIDAGMKELVIDEVSMLPAPALDVLYKAFNEVAQRVEHPIKLTPVGDFCQLPPIPDRDAPGMDRYAFEANCWRPHFSEHTTRLTRIWRQEHEEFVRALQAVRRGAGDEVLEQLRRLGVRFEPRLISDFEGTTLIATNDQVDLYNFRRLCQIPGDNTRIPMAPSARWSPEARQPSEWEHIPEQFPLKPGAYVMLLANGPGFTYVNGDCGTLIGTEGDQVVIRLKRNNNEVRIGKIIRTRTTRTRPPVRDADIIVVRDTAEYDERVRANGGDPLQQVVMVSEPRPEWITGWIKYYPLRLAYATTVHKSQGLSLDAVQIDLSSDFLGSPSMMYVALSRCRTPEGLVLVGTPEQVIAKTRIDPRVTEWL